MLSTAIACKHVVSCVRCICNVFTYVVDGVSYTVLPLSPPAATPTCDARTNALLILLHTASHVFILVTVISSIFMILELFATMGKCQRCQRGHYRNFSIIMSCH